MIIKTMRMAQADGCIGFAETAYTFLEKCKGGKNKFYKLLLLTAEYWRRFFNGFKTKIYYENRT
jgi:hypothetical protein